MNILKRIVEGIAVAVGMALAAACVWLMMSFTGYARADVPVNTEPVIADPAAAPIFMTIGGTALDDAKFLRAVQSAAYANGLDVIAADGRRVTIKAPGKLFSVPVNKGLQWDAEARHYVYRIEVVRQEDRIVLRYLPGWGSTNDRLLRDLRGLIAERIY